MDLQVREARTPSVVGAETACAASACVTAVTLEKFGASCVSATTSTVSATKENSAQVSATLRF